MTPAMQRGSFSLIIAVGLFLGMILLLELGRRLGQRRLGQRRQGKGEEGGRAGLGAVEGAVFALLGLLVAFTFSSAASRFDTRRQLILEEANAIGTAWLRLDLLPPGAQPDLRDLFRRYLDTRLAIYQKLPDREAAHAELARANSLQGEIWSRAVGASPQTSALVLGQVVPALNQMFDIATARTMAAQTHQPTVIFGMLGALVLMSSLLAGFGMAGGHARSWIHMIGFALVVSVTVYVILDLEFPRIGLIRVDAADRVLLELRDSMR